MAFILIIDTANDKALVGFAKDGEIVAVQQSNDQKNHASFLQLALQQLLEQNTIFLATIDAVAVVNGPGSYTGLRVGLASAKGLCYTLNKPLILLNTLEVLAIAAIDSYSSNANALYCPMIDARRMEVFTAIYDKALNTILKPQPLIVLENSFDSYLDKNEIVFCGNGYQKLISLLGHTNTRYAANNYSINEINKLAQIAFSCQNFANFTYAEPYYLKDFHSLIT